MVIIFESMFAKCVALLDSIRVMTSSDSLEAYGVGQEIITDFIFLVISSIFP